MAQPQWRMAELTPVQKTKCILLGIEIWESMEAHGYLPPHLFVVGRTPEAGGANEYIRAVDEPFVTFKTIDAAIAAAPNPIAHGGEWRAEVKPVGARKDADV